MQPGGDDPAAGERLCWQGIALFALGWVIAAALIVAAARAARMLFEAL
jgi:hypothetical protein